MLHTVDQSGITFAVDEVTPATEPFPECRSHEAVKRMLSSEIESCCDYHGTVIQNIHYQPLLAAVYSAFSQHRPLVLTPDAVWITIVQGVAHHMTIHGEQLRSRFVEHQGKLDLIFECDDWVEGSPENPWPLALASWAGQIRDHVGTQVHDALVCDFSTTGPVERAVSQIVMMDVFERYFHYSAYCICGIPTVTLEGSPDDWQRLADKARSLEVFDLDWWLAHLLPICDQLVRASRGDVDLKHWQGICKLREQYGGHIINGWVGKLFPYLRAFIQGPCNQRNPIFETGEGFQTLFAPPGLSRVPFLWRNLMKGTERQMEAVGGLVGVTQDPQTLALKPKVGWAVREAEKMDVFLSRLATEHKTSPGLGKARPKRWPHLPCDLAKFYDTTNGAELCWPQSTGEVCRLVAAGDIESLDSGEPLGRRGVYGPDDRNWHRFAWLADGSWLAMNLCFNKHMAPWAKDRSLKERSYALRGLFAPICHGASEEVGWPSRSPVIALSFTELLERMLDGAGWPYWLHPEFVGYGSAEQYTYRG